MKYQRKLYYCIIPGFLGLFVFSVIPFFRIVYYSLINNLFSRQFVGLANYQKVLTNEFFLLALKNSLLMIVLPVPVLTVSAFMLCEIIQTLSKQAKILSALFILPMVVPSGSIIMFWHDIFRESSSAIPIYILFCWKNLGLAYIIFSAALAIVDKSSTEAAAIDGANKRIIRWRISFPQLFPVFLFVFLLEIINSFRIYRESYLYYGTDYPQDSGYTLQYYMNNHFIKLNMQNLAAASVITGVIICVIVVLGVLIQNRLREE